MIHYTNLSRGILCPHQDWLDGEGYPKKWVRIQSTQCEQKLWADVLKTLGPQFYMDVASGERVMVHDHSERDRESRAMWQGLSWIRFALNREWFGKETHSVVRNGCNVTPYWKRAFNNLSRPDRAQLKYYGSFALLDLEEVRLKSCWKRND